MATRSRKDLKVKVKEVKIPHLTKENKNKLEASLPCTLIPSLQRDANEKMEEPKKQKAHEHSIFDSKIETEEEEKPKDKSPYTTWIGEASGSKPLDTEMAVDFNEWEILLHTLG
ncbi:hypothetical protein R1flu_026243 [Riccia fluitans]|uniref:Uncharacterized protein n=1 Tax=Riccia fluitans TaxID=41844 RepID=A0ABD1XFE2_9MARC